MTALSALLVAGTAPASDSPPAQVPPVDAAGADGVAELVPDLPGLGRALQAVAFPSAGRTMVGWDDFFTATRNAEMEREADAALRAIGHAVGSPVTSLAAVLDLIAEDRLATAAVVVFAGRPADEVTDRIIDLITLLLALAALRSGAARWRHSWTGTAELVAIDGSFLDLGEPATLAADPASVGLARARLTALGIDPVAAARPDPAQGAARVPVHGGVVNVLANGARTDVLILETGLLLIPALPRSRNGAARRRLGRLAAAGIHADGTLVAAPRESDLLSAALLAPTGLTPALSPIPAVVSGPPSHGSAPVAAPTAVFQSARVADSPEPGALPGNRFLPFADIVRAAVMQGRRRQWELTTADGSVLTVRTTLDSDELHGGWSALDEAVAFLARTRPPATTRDDVPTPSEPAPGESAPDGPALGEPLASPTPEVQPSDAPRSSAAPDPQPAAEPRPLAAPDSPPFMEADVAAFDPPPLVEPRVAAFDPPPVVEPRVAAAGPLPLAEPSVAAANTLPVVDPHCSAVLDALPTPQLSPAQALGPAWVSDPAGDPSPTSRASSPAHADGRSSTTNARSTPPAPDPRRDGNVNERFRDGNPAPTSGGPVPAPAPTSGL